MLQIRPSESEFRSSDAHFVIFRIFGGLHIRPDIGNLQIWRSKIKSKKILAPVFQGESVGRHRKIVRSLFRQYPCLQLFPSCTCVHSTHVVGLNHNLVQPHHMCCGDTTCAVGTPHVLWGHRNLWKSQKSQNERPRIEIHFCLDESAAFFEPRWSRYVRGARNIEKQTKI